MIKIIVAMTSKKVIGNRGKIPWHYKEDFKHFKNETLNSVVLMGRKTYESIGRPLPNRDNIVISTKLKDDRVDVCQNFNEGLKKAKQYDKDVFIIGGTLVYSEGLKYADELIISHIKKDYEGDTYFPTVDLDKYNVYKTKSFEGFEIKWYKKK